MTENNKTYKRVGETSKCPACGIHVDEGAYRCPKCFIYFCFKCRRRVQTSEVQSQCLNQKCAYYGKLLCKICIKQVPQYKVVKKELKESLLTTKSKVIATLIILSASGLLLFNLGLTGLLLIVVAFALAAPPAFFVSSLKKSKMIDEEVLSGNVESCIACSQPVEKLRASS